MARTALEFCRTFGNFVVIAALTSPMVASGLTSIVKGKLRAKAGGFAAADIVKATIPEL